jgi:hypothetical protein
VPTPRPPVEGRGAAPQTPLHKGWSVSSLTRSALASQWESICGLGLIFWGGSKTKPGVINRKSLSRWRSLCLDPKPWVGNLHVIWVAPLGETDVTSSGLKTLAYKPIVGMKEPAPSKFPHPEFVINYQPPTINHQLSTT